MKNENEIDRVRKVYRQRDETKGDTYTWLKPDIHAAIFTIDYAMSRMLLRSGVDDLRDLKILDVGCGRGRWLRVMNEWGADSSNLHGIEINPDRVELAKKRSPHLDIRLVDGEKLPFEGAVFDLITCKTVFSSILDPGLRQRLAKLMTEVCKREGKILIFDFNISDPANKNTIGIRRSEVERIFPGWNISSKSVLLAPPLLRLASRVSPCVGVFLEWLLPFFRTHKIYMLSRDI